MPFKLFDLRLCQHYMDGRSQIKVHTDERTQVHNAQSSLAVTHPSTNRAQPYTTSVTKSKSTSKHWSPSRTSWLLNFITDVCSVGDGI